MKTIIKGILFFVLALLFVNTFNAQSISGKITNTEGVPISNVKVVLEESSKVSMTNSNGYFSFNNVGDGVYTLTISHQDYKIVSKSVTIKGDTNVSLDVSLFEIPLHTQYLDQLIITGVIKPSSKIESSVSVTTLDHDVIMESVPRFTAEIFRTIPGIRSESSGGEGNANISVRGAPISAGGARYVQVQEDGLPILLFGDITFATADNFLRFDNNVKRIEAIRGGSASILSSNSPGGIINFISKTGKEEGGAIGTTLGLDYNTFRTDFDYGSKINNGLYFHIGGFYRVGEGVRNIGFTGNDGGQFKLSLTKEFEKGNIRVYAKFLNDKAVNYMPIPALVTGTNSNPNWQNAPNFDATTGALHTVNLLQTVGLGGNGELRRGNLTNGIHPISKAFGIEAFFDLGNNWKVTERGRFSLNDGYFIAPYPETIDTASNYASTLGTGTTLLYTDGSVVNDNRLVTKISMLEADLHNFNNFMNDFKLSKSFHNVDLTVGFFKSFQNISMSWYRNTYLQEATDNNARLINAFDASSNEITENGLLSYGTLTTNDCCQRNYDMQYNLSAPYANVTFEASKKITIDGGFRFDIGRVDGSFEGPVSTSYDINNDGVISTPEENVIAIDTANPTPVDYEYHYFSYSLGINYRFKTNQSLFSRISKGASARADRILFGDLDYFDIDKEHASDGITQAELGYKRGFRKGAFFATAFFAKTNEEGGFEATTNKIIENNYRSMGLELEGFYKFNETFSFRAACTWKKTKSGSRRKDGNSPRRLPHIIYNFIPKANFGKHKQHSGGLSFIGQTRSYAQDTNLLIMPGYLVINGFVNMAITKSLSANLAANNIFDTLAITEVEEGSITEGQNNYVRVKPLSGRTVTLGILFKF